MTNNVFVSYAREDAQSDNNLVDAFLRHGKPRERRGEISIFKDTEQINFGDEWRKKIDEALEKTDIAILMVSVNFLASDFIFEHELQVLLRKHKEEGIKILPILLGECDWVSEPDLEQFQIYPDGNESLKSMNENTFDERAVEFFRTILPQNYKTEETVLETPSSAIYYENTSDFSNDSSENFNNFFSEAKEFYNKYPNDISRRYYTVEEAADLFKTDYQNVYSFLKFKGYSKPAAFMKTPWFLTAKQVLELQKEFQQTSKLDENQMHELFKKYHPNDYEEYQSIFNTFLQWGNENLIKQNKGTIYWGQNTTGKDLGSVGWIYWKQGRKTSKYKYFLFRISGQGDLSPSFWWNTQNYSNENKTPFNDFEFQLKVLEKFARIGFSEFGVNLNSENKAVGVGKENIFTKRDSFVDLIKLNSPAKISEFLKIFDEIIEEIEQK